MASRRHTNNIWANCWSTLTRGASTSSVSATSANRDRSPALRTQYFRLDREIHLKCTNGNFNVLHHIRLQSRDLLNALMIPPRTFIAFMATLEDHYVKDNPFHNSMHAADVAQSTNVLLNTPALEGVFTPLEVGGALFAACVHDVDHPGLTNQFLINSSMTQFEIRTPDLTLFNMHGLFRLSSFCGRII